LEYREDLLCTSEHVSCTLIQEDYKRIIEAVTNGVSVKSNADCHPAAALRSKWDYLPVINGLIVQDCKRIVNAGHETQRYRFYTDHMQELQKRQRQPNNCTSGPR
jgi:hypothetical protein